MLACVAGCALLFAIFAISAPYLVKHKTVRDALIKAMYEWSEGEIKIEGPIKVSSLVALEVEVHDAVIKPSKRLKPVTRIEAQSLKAIVSFPRLLLGRVEYKKIIISSAKITLARKLPSLDPRSDKFTPTSVLMPVDFAKETPFTNLVIKRAKIIYADGPKKPYRSVFASQIKLQKDSDGYAQVEGQISQGEDQLNGFLRVYPPTMDTVPLAFWFKTTTAEVDFRGKFAPSTATLLGNASFTSTPASQKGTLIDIHPHGLGECKISGYLSWTRDKFAFDKATMSVGDYQARGSLALTLGLPKNRLEGTLASDFFDIGPWIAADHYQSWRESFQKVLALKEWPDLDLRISADHISAGPLSASPVALALSSNQGRVSADLAEIGLFNGTVSGRIDYDTKGLVIRAAGKRVDVDTLNQGLGLSIPLKGSTDFKFNLKDDLTQSQQSVFTGISGQFSMTVTGANVLETNTLHALNVVLLASDPSNEKNQHFTNLLALTLEGTIDKNMAHGKLEAKDDVARLFGTLHVNLADQSLAGDLFFDQIDAIEKPNGGATPKDAAAVAKLAIAISGPVASLSFNTHNTAAGQHHFSN